MKFHNILISWYLENKRDLPWRKTNDPYKIWLSEVILQQTRVAQGLDYYLKFVNAFPNVKDLASAQEEEILKLWQGLGYYSRARNLHFSAKFVQNELDGVFPTDYKTLLQLKGVGDYTAAAIASFCFDEAVAVVDGNVYRVLARFFGVSLPINSTEGVKYFKKIAQEVLDKNQPAIYNQAIMEFGALQCKPVNPNCEVCPLHSNCVARLDDKVALLPIKEKKIKVKKRFFNFIVFQTPNYKTILRQRTGKGIWENLYEFPLIETENLIDIDALLTNSEFINLVPDASKIKLFNSKTWIHKLSHQHLYTHFWMVNSSVENKDLIEIATVQNYPVPRLISKFLEEDPFSK